MEENTEIQIVGTNVIVHINAHEMDMYSVPEIRQEINPLLADRPGKLIINLEKTHHLDSSALGMLFKFKQQVESYQGKFYLAGINENLETLMAITRSDQVFRITRTVDEALAN